jgi:hypothetical protein
MEVLSCLMDRYFGKRDGDGLIGTGGFGLLRINEVVHLPT